LEIKIPLKNNSYLLLLGVINPWFEEWFWRVILARFLTWKFGRIFALDFALCLLPFSVLLFLTRKDHHQAI